MTKRPVNLINIKNSLAIFMNLSDGYNKTVITANYT